MKHFVFAIALILGLVFSQLSTVQAQDYYVGPNTMGMDCYLMTNTINPVEFYYGGRDAQHMRKVGGIFTATLKMVGRSVRHLDYKFDIGTAKIIFRNSDGYSGEVTEATLIENNMCRHILENYVWR